MLIMAATALYDIATIEDAYRSLAPLLGSAASVVFGIALLTAGISSLAVGTLAGQLLVQGFIHREILLWLRRVVTMLPALLVIALGIDPTNALVLSQVALSFALPFALVPLVWFTSQAPLMKGLRNHWLTTVAASLVTVAIIALNVALIVQEFS